MDIYSFFWDISGNILCIFKCGWIWDECTYCKDPFLGAGQTSDDHPAGFVVLSLSHGKKSNMVYDDVLPTCFQMVVSGGLWRCSVKLSMGCSSIVLQDGLSLVALPTPGQNCHSMHECAISTVFKMCHRSVAGHHELSCSSSLFRLTHLPLTQRKKDPSTRRKADFCTLRSLSSGKPSGAGSRPGCCGRATATTNNQLVGSGILRFDLCGCKPIATLTLWICLLAWLGWFCHHCVALVKFLSRVSIFACGSLRSLSHFLQVDSERLVGWLFSNQVLTRIFRMIYTHFEIEWFNNYCTSSDPHHDMYTFCYWQIFWHSIWHIFWHSIWHSIWHTFWHSTWHIFWHMFWHIFWHIFWHSIWHSIWHTFWHSIWHIFWHSIWHIFWHPIWRSIWQIFWHSIWQTSWHFI